MSPTESALTDAQIGAIYASDNITERMRKAMLRGVPKERIVRIEKELFG